MPLIYCIGLLIRCESATANSCLHVDCYFNDSLHAQVRRLELSLACRCREFCASILDGSLSSTSSVRFVFQRLGTHYPCLRAVLFTGRVYGPWTRLVNTG